MQNSRPARKLKKKKILVQKTRNETLDKEELSTPSPALVSVVDEGLMLSHSADQAKNKFFTDINTLKKQIDKGTGLNKPLVVQLHIFVLVYNKITWGIKYFVS